MCRVGCRKVLGLWALVALFVAGCEQPKALVRLRQDIVRAGAGSADQIPLRAVIPSRPAVETHTIVVEDERYMGDIARQLGVTVDTLLANNALREPTLQRGQVLRVQTSADLVSGYEARRAERQAAKIRRDEEKRQAKAKAEADARAAKMLAKRLKKLKGKAAEAALTQAKQQQFAQSTGSGADVTHKSPGGATVRVVRVAPRLAVPAPKP